MDGLGHVVQTELVSDPYGPTYTAASFDGMGRPYSVYNPNRCSTPTTNCGESSWGVTINTYDALGRTTQIAKPDGSNVSTIYSGKLSTVTDEAGNQRTSQTDGLGRITAVWEAPNTQGYNYETQYQYDALNNLLCAVQQGTDTTAFKNCVSAPVTWRPRSFGYDSLSRLTSATNPETGAITYLYDANGNLSQKNSPLPNQTGASQVTTKYAYDALNRLTQKSFTGMAGQPVIRFGYDGVAPSGCTPTSVTGATYLIGRRSSLCDGAGSAAWSYDAMGRTLEEERNIKGVTKKFSYSYYCQWRTGLSPIS